MKKQAIALLLALLMTASLVGCSKDEQENDGEENASSGTAVEVQTVERGDIFTESTVTGNVMANRNVPVMPPVAGMVKEVMVQTGDLVEEGDVLFTMDTADIRDTYKALLDSYDSSKALLDEQVRQAQQSLDNLLVLYEMGAVAKTTVEQTELALLQAQTSRETTLAQMGVDNVLDVLEDPNVRATVSGTVTSVAVTAGVMASDTSVGVVVSEIGKPQAVVNVSEALQPYIRVGDQVEVTISSQTEPITGTVASVSSAVNVQTGLYQVNIDLSEELQVSIGMFATVTFRTDARYDAVLAPTEAILTDGGEQYVFVVSDGAAYRVVVTTGLAGDTQTEITSGLSGGESLVVVGQSYLSDGAPVRIVEG